MFTNIDKNLLIASLESALNYARHSVGVTSLEELTQRVAAQRLAFDADPSSVSDDQVNALIATLQALEIPPLDKLSRLLTTSGVTTDNTYLAVCSWATLLNKPTTFPPEAHTHPWSEISYKPISYPPETHTHPGLTTDWNALTSKPTTFPPDAHTHVKADVSDFPATMPPDAHAHVKADVSDFPATMPPDAHMHVKADVTDFPVTLPGRLAVATYTGNGATTRTIAFTGEFVPICAIIQGSTVAIAYDGRYLSNCSLNSITVSLNTSGTAYYVLILG